MEARRLLIAESNEDLCLVLAQALQSFHYVRCCRTGKEALRILRQEKPDILVLNMLLPEMDGLMLLETIASENIRPMVLALTTYRSDYLEASAHRLGVSCILMKPFSVNAIVSRVLDMKEYLRSLPPKRTPEMILAELLAPLGIVPGSSGYPVLHDAIVFSSRSPEPFLCKTVFLDTAKHHNTTVHAVESSIRRTIESSWDPDTWQQYFPQLSTRPTARVFLRQMAHIFRNAVE